LEVSRAGGKLYGVGSNIKAVNKDSNDGVVALSEGGNNISISGGAVAGAKGLDVVCIMAGVPTRK
jgi:hypothetical protein